MMGKITMVALRTVLVALLAGSLFVQTVMVALLADDMEGGVLADRRVPILLIVVLGIVTAQTVLVCVWRLVSMVRRGSVFSDGAFRYVHIVIGAFTAAAVLVFALGVVLAPGEAVAPGVVLLLGGVSLAVFAVALIVLVLRMLLAQAVAREVEATRMQTELAGVI
ncbi:transmembrane transporter [Streptomyces lividans TK24]|nr:transmembrane transporter [Streptomyces lividans TK24]